MSNIAVVFDPSIGSFNKGDEIISEAVMEHVSSTLPDWDLVRLSIHQPLGRIHRNILKAAKVKIVGGSNVASATMHPYLKQNRWNLKLHDFGSVDEFLYMGAGWAGHEAKSNFLGEKFVKGFSAKAPAMHSFRDSLTCEKAKKFGIKNGINTGCPTTWTISSDNVFQPKGRGKLAVTTLTDNTKNTELDKALLSELKKNYETVYIWFQGLLDEDYFNSLGVKGVHPLRCSLKGYTDFLADNADNLEYVGTRLHGGIRALQNNVRTIILAVDHRAIDMAKDFNLPVCPLNTVENFSSIFEGVKRKVTIPVTNVETWKQSLKNWACR